VLEFLQTKFQINCYTPREIIPNFLEVIDEHKIFLNLFHPHINKHVCLLSLKNNLWKNCANFNFRCIYPLRRWDWRGDFATSDTLSESNCVRYGRKLLVTNLCRHEIWLPGHQWQSHWKVRGQPLPLLQRQVANISLAGTSHQTSYG
jgi:hypothetical protein